MALAIASAIAFGGAVHAAPAAQGARAETPFLSQVDASAFGRRGILEIVRGELATRTSFILGEAAVRDLLITEFRIQ